MEYQTGVWCPVCSMEMEGGHEQQAGEAGMCGVFYCNPKNSGCGFIMK